MIRLKSDHIAQISNTLLRLMTLVAKLGLTLYMGRYFNFADIGVYGLVFATVMILTTVLGIRFDYIVSRDLVGSTPGIVLAKMRDQAVFYAWNYVAMGIVMAGLVGFHLTDVANKTMLIIFVLSAVESIANMTYANIISLGHPLLANVLFFIRSGLWALVVAALGFFLPEFRSADTIFIAWLIGTTSSLVLTFWAWRHLPWREVMRTPVDWIWVKKGVVACFFIWLGTIGTTAGFYVDRFIVEHNLGLDMTGVVTFYSSFTAALVTLIQSGVLAFAYPRLIMYHRDRNGEKFWHEVRKSGWHVALFAGVIAVGVGVAVPLIGYFFHRQELVDNTPTLWMLLFGSWLRSNAYTLYYILFARHQDRAIWLGDLLSLIPAFGISYVLVPYIGLIGIGYGSIISRVFLIVWRFWYVKAGSREPAIA